jgi:hypothetical protein
MISVWWMIAAFFVGGLFGAMLAALCAAGRNGHDE